jgi:hypothetical protein
LTDQLVCANQRQQARDDFARIRYPPPLLQRRSSDTNYELIMVGLVREFAFLALQRVRRSAASLEGAFMKT